MKTTRRRGRELLKAIHEATLAELAETGYARLTIEAVAARAGTGKAALYRRWPAKRDLVLDALNAALPDLTQPLDEAADLREALLACLSSMSDALVGRTAFPGAAVLVEMLREPELGEAFRDRLIAARLELLRSVLVRAAERGEIDRSVITPLAIRTGPALVLQGVLMTGEPPSAGELEQIVDQIVLPILKPSLSKDTLNVMSPPAIPHHRHRDPMALRAIAHPVRMRLLELVAVAGQATATELAEQVGESPANTSWHLRQLAKYGFIEPATGGSGRERPWRYVPRSYSSGGSDEDPELAAASDASELMVSEREFEQLRAWTLRRRGEPAEWIDAAFTLQTVTWLTPQEFGELKEQLYPLFMTHIERVLDPSRRPADGRLARLFAWGIPAPG